MNDFYTQLAEGMMANLVEKGEPVTVVFATGSTRDILAIIWREAISPVPEARETSRPPISLLVVNRASAALYDTGLYASLSDAAAAGAVTDPGGVGWSELDRNTTRFRFPRREGLDPALYDANGMKIKKIPVQLPSGMLVEL